MNSSKFLFLNNYLNNLNSTSCRLFQLNRFSNVAKNVNNATKRRTSLILSAGNKSISQNFVTSISSNANANNNNEYDQSFNKFNGSLVLGLFGLLGKKRALQSINTQTHLFIRIYLRLRLLPLEFISSFL
jgi:hypothetical protein